MLFEDWWGITRVLIVGVLAYVALVLLLRTSGKRTLSKMNAFDFVVTVALGSSLATILLSKDVPLAEGVAALGILIGMQYVVAWVSSRFRVVDTVVKSSPVLLYYRGDFDTARLRRERLTPGEVRAAVRQQGICSMDQVEAVVLEAAGELSVLSKGARPSTALIGVAGTTDGVQ